MSLTIARSENCEITCEHEKTYIKQVLTIEDLRELNIEDFENCGVGEYRQTKAEPISKAEPRAYGEVGEKHRRCSNKRD